MHFQRNTDKSMHKKRGVTWGWEDSKATLVGKESGQGGWGLIQETHFSEIAGRSQNLVPLPGHTARSLVPVIFAVQCGHALSSSQWNLGVNDVTLLRTWPLIISHVPFFMLFLLPWWTQKPTVEEIRATKWKESGLRIITRRWASCQSKTLN